MFFFSAFFLVGEQTTAQHLRYTKTPLTARAEKTGKMQVCERAAAGRKCQSRPPAAAAANTASKMKEKLRTMGWRNSPDARCRVTPLGHSAPSF